MGKKTHLITAVVSACLVIIAGWTFLDSRNGLLLYLASVILILLFISSRHLSQFRSDISERILDTLLQHNPNAIAIFNLEGHLIRSNPRSFRLLGYTEEELIGKSYKPLLPDFQTMNKARLYSTVKGKSQSFDTSVLHKEGYKVDLHVTTAPIRLNGATDGIIVICQDISESKRKVEQIRHMAYYDDLTGLPNRRMFRDQLTEVISKHAALSQRGAVFYLDVDRFKLVNDSFGHDYGDMLLMQIAERFTHCVSQGDFLARTEGDEFAFFFSEVGDKEELVSIVNRINNVLEQEFVIGEFHIHLSASIGISLMSEPQSEDAETLMKHADVALTRAKEKGKNNYQIFNSEMLKSSLHKITLERELRRAIQNNEFVLYYQPQFCIHSSVIVGMEALIRWNHPQKGIISPSEFIPFAEESGLIVQIGEWVLYEACRQNKLWQDAGLTFVPIAVNLSSRQFLQSNLLEKINGILETTGLEAQFLDLEITESMTVDVEYTSQSLSDLKALGVKISIDDFGTGYSSLSYLKMFPIDKLKIDRSFIHNMMRDANDSAIVSTIISMTQHLQLKVIAEGVETEEQLMLLREHQCNEVQGYRFSPPLPCDRMEDLLKHSKKIA